MYLSSLATLNFSLSILIGILSSPLSYIRPLGHRPIIAAILVVLLGVLAPSTVLFAGAKYWGLDVGDVLVEAAFGWDVGGMTTQVVVWCVWWPAWVVGGMLLWGKPRAEEEEMESLNKIANGSEGEVEVASRAEKK